MRHVRFFLSPLLLCCLLAGMAWAQAPFVWNRPTLSDLPPGVEQDHIRAGAEIFARTFAFVGPQVSNPDDRYAGNNLACGNCHLDLGRKKFAFLLVGAAARYPRQLSPGGAMQTLDDRINQCMQRSMAGRALPADHPALRAMRAYITHLSAGIPPGAVVEGGGRIPIPPPEQPANPQRGARLYQDFCAECHRARGQGAHIGPSDVPWGYAYPPLWGPDSFASNAGLAEPNTMAGFIHANMPNGTDWLHPRLTVQQSHDVAAFVLSHRRPERPGRPAEHLAPAQ